MIERSRESRAALSGADRRGERETRPRPQGSFPARRISPAWVRRFAPGEDKLRHARPGQAINIGIVTAYNDMLSAHQPYGRYPEQIKLFAREVGATAQVAGGVPAMCDGVTQGQPGMELSLFSRDVIAHDAPPSPCRHDAFDAAVCAWASATRSCRASLIERVALWPPAGAVHCPRGPHGRRAWPTPVKPSASAQLYAEGKAARDELLLSRRWPPITARGLHLLRHGQFQPDDDGGDGPAHAGRRLRQSRNQSCARPWTQRRDSTAWPKSFAGPVTIGRSGFASMKKALVNACRACWRPEARPITPSTFRRSPNAPAS